MTQDVAIQSAIRETNSTRYMQLYVVWDGKLQDWVTREPHNVRIYEIGQRPGGAGNAATHLVTRGKVRVCEDHFQ